MNETILIYFAVALGVAVSVVLPIIRQLLPKPKKVSGLGLENKWEKRWKILKPYVITGIFSLIIALIIVAFMGELIKDWKGGFLAGYTADATLQKISTSNES